MGMHRWIRLALPATLVMASVLVGFGLVPSASGQVIASAVPTVALVATLAPVATATPAASGSVRTRELAPQTGDQCATPDPTYANHCGLEMVIVAPTVFAGDSGWRVGDLIKVEIRVRNHSATALKFMEVSAHVDFVLSELQLVNASKTPVPVSTPEANGNTIVDGFIIDLTDSSLPSKGRIVLKNYYSEAGPTGKIDFEAGIFDIADSATVPANTGDVLIGSFYVRVKTNPSSDGTYTLTLRAQNAVKDVNATDGARNSVICDGSSDGTAGLNIMGKATSAVLPVKKTTVDLSLAVGQPVGRPSTRTGDTIPVTLQLSNSTNMFVRNATSIDAAVSFDTTWFTLVTANATGDDSKVSVAVNADDATVADITGATADALVSASAQTAGRKYTETGTTGTVTLKLDSAIAIDFTGTAATKTVATIYLRPRYNTASQDVTIVSGAIIGIRDNTNMGFRLNVTATAATSPVTVTTTTVNLTMVPTLPSPIRVGDAIPVALKIAPTDARYVNRIETTIVFDATRFQLVQDGTTAYTPVTNGAAVSLAGSALTAGGNNASAATNTFAIAGSVGTITLNVSGAFLTEGTTPILVGTFYVRPLKKTASSHPIDFSGTIASRAGEKRSTNVDPGLDFLIAVTPATSANNGNELASPAIGPIIGTLGVSLKMRSPTVADPTLAADGVGWISSASNPATLNVVDDRFLDVLVQVDAANTVGDARNVDDFVIDVAFDNRQLSLGGATTLASASCAGTGNDRAVVCKPATNVTGTVAVTTSSSISTMRLTLQSSAMLTTPAEVARVRFQILSPGDNSAPVALNVADTTILRQKTSASNLFVTDNYANIRPSTNYGLGEFDSTPTTTHQKPATLQVSTRLQGRTTTNVASRFVQNFGIELRKAVSDGGTAVTRHLTVTTAPASVRTCSTTCDPAMLFDKFSKKASAGPNAEFAVSDQSGAVAEPLSDLEPGTYDVYLKGRSSVAVLVTGVTFGAGSTKLITGLVLREGDIDHNDVVDGADFSTFAPAMFTNTGTFGYVGAADFNQSDFIDILDYSLLASNFNTSGTGADVLNAGSSTVSVNRLRPSGTYTMPTIVMTPATTDYAIGDVVPVTVTLNPGSHPVDGVQIVIRAGNGAELVGTNAFVIATSSPLSLIFSDAVNAGRNLIELALGRSPRATVSGPTVLGTVNVRITGDVTGDLLTIDADGNGQFATMIAGGGENLLDPATYGYVVPVSEPIVSGPTVTTLPPTAVAPPAIRSVRSIRVANVRDTSFTVSWVADRASTGMIRWGQDDGSSPTNSASDKRGATGTFTVHFATVSGLAPSTSYRFDVVSGSTTDTNGGAHYVVTTGPTLGATAPDQAFGTVSLRDGSVPASVVMHLTASGPSGTSAPLAALVTTAEQKYWAVNLGNLRTATLDAPFPVTADTILTVTADGGPDGTAASTSTVAVVRAGTLALTLLDEVSQPLQAGWNLISLRAAPTTSMTASMVCTALNAFTAGTAVELDRWINGGWDGHRCGLPVNDFTLEPGPGYFVRLTRPATWTYRGAVVATPATLSLGAGWNLVGASAISGTPSVASATCSQLNTVQAGTAVELDRWIDGGWEGHRCGLPVNDFTLQAGQGYFVRLTRPATWAPVGAAPVSASSIRNTTEASTPVAPSLGVVRP